MLRLTNLYLGGLLLLAAPAFAQPAALAGFGCSTPLTPAQVQAAESTVRGRLPSTPILGATAGPDGTCLVSLRLGNGQTAYTDVTGRYFFFGALLDLQTGQQLGARLVGPAQQNLKGLKK